MNSTILPPLLSFYGIFLSGCGIISVIFIGRKAKTALMSGGTSGVIALYLAWLIANNHAPAVWAGIVLSFLLFVVFSWRATKTLHKVFELIPVSSPELNGKGVAFLIISLMAVVSLMVFVLQIIVLNQVLSPLTVT